MPGFLFVYAIPLLLCAWVLVNLPVCLVLAQFFFPHRRWQNGLKSSVRSLPFLLVFELAQWLVLTQHLGQQGSVSPFMPGVFLATCVVSSLVGTFIQKAWAPPPNLPPQGRS